MKKSSLALFLGLASLLLVGCETTPIASSSTQGGSSTPPPSSGSNTSTSSEAEGSGEIVSFNGIVRIAYHNDANDYGSKRLWIWANGIDGAILGETRFDNQDEPDDYGVYKDIDLSAAPFGDVELASIYFIVKEMGTWAGQSKDILLNFGDFISNKETVEGGKEMITCYAVQGSGQDIETYASKNDALGDRLEFAYFSDWRTINATGSGAQGDRELEDVGRVASYNLYAYGADDDASNLSNYLIKSGTPDSNSFSISLDNDADPSLNYVIEATFTENLERTRSKFVSFNGLYDTEKFINELVYNGDDLGYTESDGNCYFKLWAPTASKVELFLYQTGQTPEVNNTNRVQITLSNHQTRTMSRGEYGVWTYTCPIEEMHHSYYTFSVTTALGTLEVIDPYAKATSINGLRAYRISKEDFQEAEPANFDADIAALNTTYGIKAPNELSIYEIHIRDLTMDDTWNGESTPGTYKAFIEEGTTYTGTNEAGQSVTVKTGFDHIVETGVNAVQLLPVFDHDNDERTILDGDGNVIQSPSFNWGYNPQNFNCVEGSYSSDPYDASVRILEYKELVQAFAKKGIRVIMDVVYNHVSSVTNFSMNKIVPDYFMRLNEDGSYHDGSGTGNVTASERPMVRNFIVDSVKFWASEYGIKGFRFDLMGCLDVTTMRAVKDALYDIDPSIVVYGEGWSSYAGSGLPNPKDASGNPTDLSLTECNQENVYKHLWDENGKGYVGCFNAGGRDGLKGETEWGSNLPGYGFISQGEEHLSNSTAVEAASQFIGTNSRGGGNPAQTLNYVACHDNYTLYDQLNYCLGTGTLEGASIEENLEAAEACVALNASMMLSQGMAFLHGGDEMMRQKYLTPDSPYFSIIEAEVESGLSTDGFIMGDGNMLVRNSYNYGDECNSFKWDRKVTFYDEYQQTIASIALRNDLLEEGVLGQQYTDEGVNSWIWGDLTNGNWGTAAMDRTSIAANFAGTHYVMLGGRTTKEWSTMPCGNDTLKVLYSSNSKHDVGSTFTVSNYQMGVGRFELLLVQKIN